MGKALQAHRFGAPVDLHQAAGGPAPRGVENGQSASSTPLRGAGGPAPSRRWTCTTRRRKWAKRFKHTASGRRWTCTKPPVDLHHAASKMGKALQAHRFGAPVDLHQTAGGPTPRGVENGQSASSTPLRGAGGPAPNRRWTYTTR